MEIGFYIEISIKLGDIPARFACQPRLGLQPQPPATFVKGRIRFENPLSSAFSLRLIILIYFPHESKRQPHHDLRPRYSTLFMDPTSFRKYPSSALRLMFMYFSSILIYQVHSLQTMSQVFIVFEKLVINRKQHIRHKLFAYNSISDNEELL